MHEIKVHCTLKVHGAKQWILYITYVQITVHAPRVVYTGKCTTNNEKCRRHALIKIKYIWIRSAKFCQQNYVEKERSGNSSKVLSHQLNLQLDPQSLVICKCILLDKNTLSLTHRWLQSNMKHITKNQSLQIRNNQSYYK